MHQPHNQFISESEDPNHRLFIGACVLEKAPLTAVQMLWVNLIMDTFAALALATEPPNEDLLKRKPVKPDDSLVTPDMMKMIIGMAVYQSAWLLVILFLGPDLFGIKAAWDNPNEEYDSDYAEHFTIFFNTFVFLQVFNEINCRKLKSSEWNVFKGFFNNWMFLAIIIFTIIMQWVLVTVGGRPISVVPLSWEMHGYCVAIGAGGLIWGFFVRLLPTSICRCCKISDKPLDNTEADRKSLAAIMRRKPTKQLKASVRLLSRSKLLTRQVSKP